MSDPSNFTKIIPCLPAKHVTALCYVGNSLWIGDKTGRICIAQKIVGSNEEKFRIRLTIDTFYQRFMVKTLIAINEPRCVLAHFTTASGSPGPAVLIRAGGIISPVADQATRVDTSFSVIQPNIFIECQNKIYIYKFVGDVPVQIDEPIDAGSAVSALSACNKFLMYFSNNVYHIYNLRTKQTEELDQIKVTRPMLLTLSADSILCSFDNSFCIKYFDKETVSYQHNSDYGIPKSYYADRSSLYQFYEQFFTRIDLNNPGQPQIFRFGNVKNAAMVGTELLVISQDVWGIYGSIKPPQQLLKDVQSKGLDSIIPTFESLPEDLCSSNMIALFALLWPIDQKLALELPKRFFWAADPRELLILFPQIQINSPLEKRTYVPNGNTVVITKDDFHTDIFLLLQAALELMLKKFTEAKPDSKKAKCVATSLLQVYSITIETRKFANLLQTNPNCDISLFRKFINPLVAENYPITPCLAVYYTYHGQYDKAYDIWWALYKATPNDLFAFEASQTIKEISDAKLLDTTLEWLKNVQPKYLPNAIISTKHDQQQILSFLEENEKLLPHVKLQYYDFIVQQPQILPLPTIIQGAFDSYVTILDDIGHNKFNIDQIAFTNSYQEQEKKGKIDEETLKREVTEELTRKTMNLLMNRLDQIGNDKAMKKIEGKILDNKIKLSIYKANNNYEDGIKEILTSIKDPNNIPYDDIEDFCRTSTDPQKAFAVAFSLIPSDQLFTNNARFINNNIEYIDILQTVKLIPKNLGIRIAAPLITSMFNLMTQRNEELDKQMAITKSMQEDADFYLQKEKSEYATLIENETKCSVCKKAILSNHQLAILPDGSLCHKACIQK